MVGFAIALPTLHFTFGVACYILPMLRLLATFYPWRSLLPTLHFTHATLAYTRKGGVQRCSTPYARLPYLTAMTEDAERVLFLRKYNVPFHALSYVLGRNAMKWFRISQNIGRNSIVSTTIKYTTDLPQHVVADEKHTWIKGEKAYIAITNANNCILGASIVKNADESELTKAYGVFKKESDSI